MSTPGGPDSHLYGLPKPKKHAPIPLSSTSIHALSAELSLARSALPKSKTTSARPRPPSASSSKTAALFRPNKNVASRAAKDLARDGGGRTSSELGGGGVSERELARSRRRMKEKAKLYDKLKRGDVEDEKGVGLVDFERKWAEHGDASSEDDAEDDAGSDGGAGELVEYEDEFGRTRKGTRKEAERERLRKEAAEKEEAENNPPPKNLIYGSVVQTHAFQTAEFSSMPSPETLAAALPPDEGEDIEEHYDASKEVRTKGVGFYQFSKDARARKDEMERLEEERRQTEKGRAEREERKKRKREEIERRKEEVRRKRREKVGGAWLEQFGSELVGEARGDEKA